MEPFPPNSKASKGGGPRQPRERVVQAEARRRRAPLGKKFTQTFMGGDARTAWDYMIFENMIPAARDMVVDGLQSYIERLFNGNVRPRSRGHGPNPYGGYTAYSEYSRGPARTTFERPPLPARQQVSSQARARHDFDEIILETRMDAEEVLTAMYDILGSQHEVVTVADLYELVGFEFTHVDTTWGWTDLRGAGVGRVRGRGYVLDLPEPEHLSR